MPDILSQWIIILYSICLAGVSVLMLFKPVTAIRLLRKAGSTNLINYGEIGIRGIWGLALWSFAAHSRYPVVFETIGIFIGVSSIILILIPRKWHAQYAVWWADQLNPWQVRLLSPISLIFAVWMIYAAM